MSSLPRRNTVSRRACLALALSCAPIAHAADAAASLSPLTWGLLAAMGLVGVAIAALALSGPRGTAPRAPRVDADSARAGADARERAPSATLPDSDAAAPAAVAIALPPPAAVRTRGHGIVASPAPGDDAPCVAAASAAGDDAAAASAAPVPSAASAFTPVPAKAAGVPRDELPPFLALHHIDVSIAVLREHLDSESRPLPAVWVMLLDLCRTHGREATFRDIAAAFHARFNVRAPEWETYPPERDEAGLEAHPQIIRELTQTWGTHECRRLLDRLLFDKRDGERRDFTLNAYNDLIALRRAADAVLDTIERDFAAESGPAAAGAQGPDDELAGLPPGDAIVPSPLAPELERHLEAELRERDDARSALEREHPAFAAALVREWGNAAAAARLCEMLARSGEGSAALSTQAREELALLQTMAQRLAEANGITLAVG